MRLARCNSWMVRHASQSAEFFADDVVPLLVATITAVGDYTVCTVRAWVGMLVYRAPGHASGASGLDGAGGVGPHSLVQATSP